jgi:hypothetical protein
MGKAHRMSKNRGIISLWQIGSCAKESGSCSSHHWMSKNAKNWLQANQAPAAVRWHDRETVAPDYDLQCTRP